MSLHKLELTEDELVKLYHLIYGHCYRSLEINGKQETDLYNVLNKIKNIAEDRVKL